MKEEITVKITRISRQLLLLPGHSPKVQLIVYPGDYRRLEIYISGRTYTWGRHGEYKLVQNCIKDISLLGYALSLNEEQEIKKLLRLE